MVGLALVVFYTVDTAAATWGPVYLDDVFDAPERLVALATLPYLVASGLVRLAGDRLTEQVGAVRLLRVMARFNQFNYAGALLGAVMTGAVGAGSLRVGFAVPLGVVTLFWLARAFAPADDNLGVVPPAPDPATS